MVATIGLTGLRPTQDCVARVASPPYDVIKPGTGLQKYLEAERDSLYHVILGTNPRSSLARLIDERMLMQDEEPCYYVYEQSWSGGSRTGVLVAAAVTPYERRQIIRHEKTFDAKVKDRIALRRATGYTFGPVFVLTRARIEPLLQKAKRASPIYEFASQYGGHSELEGIANKVWRVPETIELGRAIQAALGPEPLYIADGHHRYHASLLNEQTHFLCYVTEEARIQAYNRVINGVQRFSEVSKEFGLRPATGFDTPPKHQFCIYTRDGSFILDAQRVPVDVVGRLDCSILERELYPVLGLTHDMIVDPNHFDYYSESALDEMKGVVDRGEYDIAVALHPVSLEELVAVADAGLEDPDIVMPEKSTFFAPKILSGLFVYRHTNA